MKDLEEHVLRTAKEIIVKFIEVGRISPSTFGESFRDIYQTIYTTAKSVESDSVKVEKSK